jgi:hypothetical protein
VFYALALVAGLVYFDGTGDVGDSVVHYVFARYAPKHPELYFDHWAKPVYVLLASPFAQFGFNGVKAMNILLTLASVYLTYRVATLLKYRNAWIAGLILAFSPLYYIITLSGLTEPMFAFVTILSVYYCLRGNFILASIVLSFLPYVRSEGLIMIGVFGLYFLFTRKLKAIPFLITGSLVYALAGWFVYHDILWVFTKIPYASLSSVYGSGSLFHFVDQLVNVTGVPVYFLVWLGLFAAIAAAFSHKGNPESFILLILGFLCFFIAHTLFWYLGIFQSMGLKRVFVGVLPLIALIALGGLNFIYDLLATKKKLQSGVVYALLFYIIVFPFTKNPSAIQWDKDLMLAKEQVLAKEVSDKTKMARATQLPVMYNHFYLGMMLDNDRFDSKQRIPFSLERIKTMPSGAVIIWDDKQVAPETGIKMAELDADTTLRPLYRCHGEAFGLKAAFAAYQKK